MALIIQILLSVLLAYLGVSLALYWVPLLAVMFRPRALCPTANGVPTEPRFIIVASCRDGAACIPGLVQSFRDQRYPPGRQRLYLIADHCTDNSADVARTLGMEVYERRDSGIPGKGNAVSELLTRRLKNESFDVLLVIDVDGRVDPDFLRRAAAYFQSTPVVLSCATFAKNPDETLLAHIGALIQALLRLNQEGRAALGLDAILYGSHGYALSYDVLERLGWRTTTGLVAEDMELRTRCALAGLPIRYGADLPVYNDVTADAISVYRQRRRWNATYPPLVARYAAPLLRRGLWDALWAVLLLPAPANLFLYLSFAGISLGVLAGPTPFLRPYAIIAAVLWAGHAAYFLTAFAALKIPMGVRELWGFLQHLAIRAGALAQGLFMMHRKDWAPAPHPASNDAPEPRAASKDKPEEPEGSKEFWDKVFFLAQHPVFQVEMPDKNDPVFNAALTYFGDVTGKRMLDLGCGTGKSSIFFAQQGAAVTSIDTSQVALNNLAAYCTTHGIPRISPINMTALKITDIEPVDFVFGSMILHHIEPFDKFVLALKKTLAPNGKAFFLENNANCSLMIWCRQHIVGKFWIPKWGDSEEFPLTRQEIDHFRGHFKVRVVYPELYLFRMVSTYLFRGHFFKGFKVLDDLFFNIAWLRKYSYRQYLFLS